MTSPRQSLVAWLRGSLTWSNSGQAWRERAGLGLALAGVVAAYSLSDTLPLGAQVALWFALLVSLSFLLRRGWFTFLGPVFFYDLVRTTRRSRFTLYRAYAYLVLALVAVFYVAWQVANKQGRPPTNIRDVGEFAQAFFLTFMGMQLLVVAVVTPGYVAGVIADEKDRRTIEYLLATDLRNREIVLSKLGARLANLLLMLLTGLPIMSAVEFMGGVDPDFVLVGFAATGLTMISLASFGILCSVHARKSREAILLTYLGAGVYLLLSTLCVLLGTTPVATFTVSLGPWRLSGGNLINLLASGNPLLQIVEALRGAASGGSGRAALAARLEDYALFHGVASAICVGLACLRLRVVFLKQASEQPARSWRGKVKGHWIGVGDFPMLWKEIIVERGFRFRIWGKLLRSGLVLGTFVPAVWIFLYSSINVVQRESAVGEWSRFMGAMVACLLLIAVAVRASTSISSERDRQTVDNLLTTPLDSTAILLAKWLGNMASVRWGWAWLGLIWGLGVAFGDLHVLAVPLLVLAWMVYASFFVVVGLWYSLFCRTSQRATVFTILTAIAVGIGFVAIPASMFRFYGGYTPWDRFLEWVTRVQLGMTPPAVLGSLLPFHAQHFGPAYPGTRPYHAREAWEMPMALLGLSIWAVSALLLWFVTSRRFRHVTGRQAVRKPERANRQLQEGEKEETGMQRLGVAAGMARFQ